MTTEVATTEVPEVLHQPGVTREAVEALGRHMGDAAWLSEQRMAAWAAFERTPMPSPRDEHWRFTNLRRVSLDGVPTHTGIEGVERARELGAGVTGAGEVAAQLLQVNGATSEDLVTRGALPEGVIFSTLAAAARDHAGLVQQHFGTAVPVGDSVNDKFVALEQATVAGGVFVYVPRNVRVELPMRADIVHAAAQGHVNWRALIVLEEGAEATFVEEFRSTADDLEGFSNAVVELVAGPAASLHYVTVQDYATPVTHFATHRVLAHRDAQVEWVAVGLGASFGKSRMEARMLGPNSAVKLTGAYFLDGRQELDYDTQQFHEAPNAMSDLAFRGVLTDRSRSVWRGMIDVAEGAQGTDSYQENRNLILSDRAHADSIPGLQIEANEVRCTHGATIAKVDPEQLFYLQARGLTRLEATKTITRGFFVPVLDRITVEAVRESVQEALWARMDEAAEEALSR